MGFAMNTPLLCNHPLVQELIDILGLPRETMKRFTLTFEPQQPVIAEVEMYCTPLDGTTFTKNYRFIPEEIQPEDTRPPQEQLPLEL